MAVRATHGAKGGRYHGQSPGLDRVTDVCIMTLLYTVKGERGGMGLPVNNQNGQGKQWARNTDEVIEPDEGDIGLGRLEPYRPTRTSQHQLQGPAPHDSALIQTFKK